MPFYEFDQNNSGGSFTVNEVLCHRVVIEADNANKANKIALGKGIYFNGVDDGLDCSCCGDRWDDVGDGGARFYPYEFGEHLFTSPEEHYQYLADRYGWTRPDARIFYKNGKIVEIFKKEKE